MPSGRSESCEFHPTTGSCLWRGKCSLGSDLEWLFRECCVSVSVRAGVMLRWPHAAACHWNLVAALSYPCCSGLQKGTLYLCICSCGDREASTECSLSGLGRVMQQYPNLPTWIASAVAAWWRAACSRCSRGPVRQMIKVIWNMNVSVAVPYFRRVCKQTSRLYYELQFFFKNVFFLLFDLSIVFC